MDYKFMEVITYPGAEFIMLWFTSPFKGTRQIANKSLTWIKVVSDFMTEEEKLIHRLCSKVTYVIISIGKNDNLFEENVSKS